MTITERLFLVLSNKNLSQKEFAKAINVNEKTVSAWKKNNSLPSADKISDISDFLNISLEYLLTGQEKSPPSYLTENEQKLIDSFKSLTPVQQGEIIGRVQLMAEQNEILYRKEEIG